ncbi:MAG: carboxyltransferase domain-containing protein, partial [Microbacterium sp.]|uniref:carboxyltransferase domain-containing protein n=1 Tax=Microbacterium sp. TaxID=51671 RepID=UPI0039E58C13
MVTAPRRVLPVGERAVLVEVGGLDAVLALHAALAAAAPAGVEELVPAARTVLVRFDPARTSAAAVRAWIAAVPDATTASGPARDVTLEVAYDGADLAETARLLGLGPAELAQRHARTPWRVAFTGFAPGFAYLVGEGWPFDVPRLDVPRTRVPAGAVGLAAGFT